MRRRFSWPDGPSRGPTFPRIAVRAATLPCLVACLAGCGGHDDPKPIPAPEFQGGQGQSRSGVEAYAPGPFGVAKGSVIENFRFQGYVNAAEGGTDALELIQLADFYNPTGADTYPAGSPYGEGKPKPRALAIDVSATWCPPCNEEARTELPARYARYAPRGGQILLQLIEGPTPGVPAVPRDLENWTARYHVNYPATLDPASHLSALVPAAYLPGNLIIDTKTMQIVEAVFGVPDESFWTKYESYLNNP